MGDTGPTKGIIDKRVVERLSSLGAHRVLLRMAAAGQIIDVQCEMPKCFCPRGRRHFDERSDTSKWKLSVDHYPKLKSEGGSLVPWNVRIGHVHCNNVDYGWRSRINALLKRGKSLEEIAQTLNRRGIARPHGTSAWSAVNVRQAFVS
jgi:hypothetical protein